MGGLVALLLLALQVEGAGDCPSAADVQVQLEPLLPADAASTAGDRAVISSGSTGPLSVSLARPDGSQVARRQLPRTGSCAEQAATVAVTLAVWEAQIHPEISLRLDRLAMAPSAPSPAAEPQPERQPTVASRSAASPPATEFLPAVGAGLVGSWQPDSLAPGGRVDATLARPGRSWRSRLTLAGMGSHSVHLPPGQANWWRGYLALGADYVLPIGRRWQLASGGGGVLGLLNATGSGYTSDRTSHSLDLGVEVLVRVELRLGAVRPWLGFALLTWLRPQTVEVTGQTASAALPRLQPLIAAGGDFCWGP